MLSLGVSCFLSTPTGRRVTLGPGGDARPSAASSGMPGTPSGNFTWRTCSVGENHRKTIGTWENHRKIEIYPLVNIQKTKERSTIFNG